MSITTRDLVDAIQTCDPQVLSRLLGRLASQPDQSKVINGQVERPNDFTPLHLAAKAYSFYRNDYLRSEAFNRMVGDLLDAGAVPWVEMGAKSWMTNSGTYRSELGKTVVEVCDGHLPPALKEWIAVNTSCRDLSGHKTTKRALDIKISGKPRITAEQSDDLRRKIAVRFQSPKIVRFA